MEEGAWQLGVPGEPRWRLDPTRGYVYGYVSVDGKKKRVAQHRWVMERHLGRRLDSKEDVHHINKERTDNRPANLMVLSHSEHGWVEIMTHSDTIYLAGLRVLAGLDKQRIPAKKRAEQREFWTCVLALTQQARQELGLEVPELPPPKRPGLRQSRSPCPARTT